MKKVVAKKTQDSSNRFDKLEKQIDDLVRIMMDGFVRVEKVLTIKADRADVLDLHDKFIHRREFDELSLRVSKLEAKAKR